ncbi:MAG: PAS domain S-box protein, partial [Cyclobacteriaceae bacterium]|nr:PAS domain S-box protein [Cyclobacteriaceae bacterium]
MKVSDQHLRSMIESQQGLVVFSLDRDYRYTFYSASHFQTIESIWGEKISLGKSMLDVIKNPADRAKAKANFDRALQGESFVLEEEYGDRQLERNFYENRYNPIKDSKGNITGLSVFVIDITRIKKVETARQEIESAYKVLFDNTTDAIFIMKADGEDIGKIVSANSAAATMHGYSLEEFLQLNIKDLDTPEEVVRFKDRIDRILNGEKISFEITHKKKAGSLFQLEVSAGLMEVGGQKYIMAIDRDITERKERERELQESEQFIKKITESSPDFIYVMDLTRNKIIFRNRHIGESLGYSEEEIQAMHGDFFSLVGHPEDVAKMHMLLSRWDGVADNVILENEFRLKHKDGEWRWFLTRDTVFKRDSQGKAIEVIGTVRDRTDKKKSELALRQSLSLLNATLESTEDGILVVDKSKKITAFNKKFLSLWRIPPEMAESKYDDALLAHVIDQLADPEKF